MTGTIQTRDGIALAFDEAGRGEPIILVHGLGLKRKRWQTQFDALLDAGYRVIRYDIRGFGDSADPLTGYILERTGLEDVAGIFGNFIQQGELVGVVDFFAQQGDGFAVAFHRFHYGLCRRFRSFDHGDHLIAHALEIVGLPGGSVDRRDFLAHTQDVSRKTIKLLF